MMQNMNSEFERNPYYFKNIHIFSHYFMIFEHFPGITEIAINLKVNQKWLENTFAIYYFYGSTL